MRQTTSLVPRQTAPLPRETFCPTCNRRIARGRPSDVAAIKTRVKQTGAKYVHSKNEWRLLGAASLVAGCAVGLMLWIFTTIFYGW